MQTRLEYQWNRQELTNFRDFPWYFGDITRERAENILLLNGENPGTFLVRDAVPQTDPPSYRISVLDFVDLKCVIYHYQIFYFRTGLFYIDEDKTFPDVESLIRWYSENNSSQLSVRLSSPCRVQFPHPTTSYENQKLSILSELPQLRVDDIIKTERISSGRVKTVEVWKGKSRSSHRAIAIKTLSPLSGLDTRRSLLQEAKTLQIIAHENIIKLFGVIVSEPVSLVTEYEECQDMLSYFLDVREVYELCLNELLRMAKEVASALQHMSSLMFVHRNIRAQNILLNRGLTCKVAGFGYSVRLNRDRVYFKSPDDLAFDNSMNRWMSIEAANDGRFSQGSDVWSYGVFLFELFTKGEMPYAEILTPHVVSAVQSGYRLKRKPGIPNSIFNIMQRCWLTDSTLRPTFTDVCDFLYEVMEAERKRLYTQSSAIQSNQMR